MPWLLLLGLSVALQSPTFAPINLTAFKIGPPTTVAELDLGKLKGDLQRVAWSPDANAIFVQTAEGRERHDFLVSLDGSRTVTPVAAEPDWAARYWAQKSDLTAPGPRSVSIRIVNDSRKRDSSFLGGAPNLTGSLERDLTPEFDPVVIYMVYEEQIGKWVSEPPGPGRTYGWGPEGTGLIAFVDVEGHVILRGRHERQVIPRVKEALLPAWSADGSKLAYVQKTGRRKYALAWVPVTRNTQ